MAARTVLVCVLFAAVALGGEAAGGAGQEREYGETHIVPPTGDREAESKCRFREGQVWKGHYGGCETYPQPTSQSDLGVTWTIGGATTLSEASVFGTVQIAYGLVDGNYVVKTRDVKSDPPAFACAAKLVSAYHLTWSDDCEHVQLNVREDYCGRRLIHYNEMKLDLVTADSKCRFQEGESWRGYYPDNNLLVGRMVNFHFGAGTNVEEVSSAGTIYSHWTHDVANNRELWAKDVGGHCTWSDLMCTSQPMAHYALEWHDDCRRVVLSKLADTCTLRTERYDTLTLDKVLKKNQCEFAEGQLWSGRYPGDDPVRSGKEVHFRAGGGMRMTESSQFGSVEEFWFQDSNGDLRTRDVQGRPSSLACCKSVMSQYSLTWSDDCDEVMFHLMDDECVMRAGVYDGLHLKHVDEQVTDPPMVVNFNFEGLVPESKCCKPGWNVPTPFPATEAPAPNETAN